MLKNLMDHLDSNGVKYVVLKHSPAFTAQEIAASAHLPGKELAKTVMVKVDGAMGMAVLPASSMIDFTRLRDGIGASRVELATEQEFKGHFPECEVGAMPPFGNLYGMKVFVDSRLTEDVEIAFNAGTHKELVRLPYDDFERLVRPEILEFGAHPG